MQKTHKKSLQCSNLVFAEIKSSFHLQCKNAMHDKVQQIFQFYVNTFFPDNNDAKPNNVESAASGSNADPYAASVSAALSSMNINAEGGANNRYDFT